MVSQAIGKCQDDGRTVPFLQLDYDILDEQFVAGNWQSELGIEVGEVRQLVGKLVAQTWVGEDLPLTVSFIELHERREKCMQVVHENIPASQ